ncbi:MAG: YqaE/Pmp3 family membrane protein [Treponema sp.]|nr:YqaE/Pmp3 family membrane protein [Treponema sp.]
MGCLRAIICIICPPLAVLDKGCGAILLTLILTCAGWIPGVIAAILFNNK